MAARGGRSRNKDRRIREKIRIPFEVLSKRIVRHLRAMAATNAQECLTKINKGQQATLHSTCWCFVAVLRHYDEAGNVIGTHEHKGEFKEW